MTDYEIKEAVPTLTLIRIYDNQTPHKLFRRSLLESEEPDFIRLTPNLEKLTFGSEKLNHPPPDICLHTHSNKFKLSRKHATIRRTNSGEFKIRDKSYSGTYVNYRRVNHTAILKNGDIICFGCAYGSQIKRNWKIGKNATDLKFQVRGA